MVKVCPECGSWHFHYRKNSNDYYFNSCRVKILKPVKQPFKPVAKSVKSAKPVKAPKQVEKSYEEFLSDIARKLDKQKHDLTDEQRVQIELLAAINTMEIKFKNIFHKAYQSKPHHNTALIINYSYLL